MDEATAGLDSQTARQMLQRLADLQQRRTLTVLAVTHRLGEVEQFGGRLVVLIDGTIAADGPAEAILADPPDEAVADLLRQRED
jgi:ABC-type multidrug transport system ATPase subunit